MNTTPSSNPNSNLRIWQQNMNKSRFAALTQANRPLHEEWDIICMQEQYMNSYDNIVANSRWRPVYPSRWSENRRRSRSLILVNTALDTNSWRPVEIPGTHDVTAIQLDTEAGKTTIFNIYND
ncbi:Endonuclease/exonuclease/phosphatase, partial [Schizophyllum amplum]